MGFGVPVGHWFRQEPELRQLFNDNILSKKALERGIMNPKAIKALCDEHDRQKDDHGQKLWALLMLELWHQKYIDTQPASPPVA